MFFDMREKKLLIIGIIVLSVTFGMIFFSNCSKMSESSIKVRLLWLNQAQFAGIYSAKERGFYKAKGLEVSIIPGGPGINPV